MAEIKKHVNDSFYCIRHTFRELPSGKQHGNEDIDRTLTLEKNYSLLPDRCQNAEDANRYRKKIEKELFKYNRKGLVRTIEIVIQCPDDCTEKDKFFQTAYQYVCDKVLPMGERSVVSAMVHGDEHKYLKDKNGNFKLDANGNKIDLSKEHIHIIAVPAVPDKKHEAFEWKLSAHDLTSKSRLKQFHPGLQKACDDAGIQATVYTKKSGYGKSIGLSVKQLKEITNKTGIVIDKSITVDELADILTENRDIKLYDKQLKEQLKIYERELASNFKLISKQKITISELQECVKSRDSSLNKRQEQIIQKDSELHTVVNENATLKQQLKTLQKELVQANERIQELESRPEFTHNWGNHDTWGVSDSWGTSEWENKNTEHKEERQW